MSGSIRRRGTRSWQVQVEFARDPVTGKRRRRFFSVKGTKRDAERALVKAQHERDTGFELGPGQLAVADYLDRWLRDYAAQNVAPSTLLRYRQIVARSTELFGGVQLAALRPAHIQSAYSVLLEEGLAPRTVLHHHRVLKQALRHAVEWQLLSRNPADGVKPPRATSREMRTLTASELNDVLDACPSSADRRLIYFAVATGLRLGELLGLRWADIDFDEGRATIRRSLQYLSGSGLQFRNPKSVSGRRSLALSPASLEVLRTHRTEQTKTRLRLGPAWVDEDLLFSREDGRPQPPYLVSSHFAATIGATRLGKVRFHDLRHTAATLMLQQGVHPKVVSERLGHATIAITLDTYSHVLPDMQREAAAVLDDILPTPAAG